MREHYGDKSTEGIYEKPTFIEERMTTIEEIAQSTREKNPQANKEILEGVLKRLALVEVKYLSKGESGKEEVFLGQIAIDEDLVSDVHELFQYIEEINKKAQKSGEPKFFIDKVVPINKIYDGDDEKSMSDNNTSAFNYRTIKGTSRLSLHSLCALDINPRDNPMVVGGVVDEPQNGKYDTDNPNTLTPNHKIVQFLKARGFDWGGDWKSLKDYHHFEKVIPTKEHITYYLKNEITRADIKLEDIVKRVENLIRNSSSEEHLRGLEMLIENENIINKLGVKYSYFYNQITEKRHNEKIRP
ncbi:MAG TPA: M15 family metallopeptidase [Candidatus Paceibacterota bacterium]|jgi:hypothetical protein|nr:M15 family metallopeptidase [Candidatus Paceibacterota bacterium]